jgi:hypothetical protein
MPLHYDYDRVRSMRCTAPPDDVHAPGLTPRDNDQPPQRPHERRYLSSMRNYCVKRDIVDVTNYPIPVGRVNVTGMQTGSPCHASKVCRKRTRGHVLRMLERDKSRRTSGRGRPLKTKGSCASIRRFAEATNSSIAVVDRDCRYRLYRSLLATPPLVTSPRQPGARPSRCSK